MKQGSSSRKINEQAREAIANILLYDTSDPRLDFVTITGCEVSFDRTACNVFYTTDRDRYEEVEEALEQAKGHIRSELAKRLTWRVAPDLRFHLDKTVDAAERVEAALNANRDRSAEQSDDAASDADESSDHDTGEEL